MVPSKIIEAILTKLLGDASGRLLQTATDRKRRFARQLLAYHRALEQYRELVCEFQTLLSADRELLAVGKIGRHTARDIDAIADKMGAAVGELFQIFWYEWSHGIIAESRRSQAASARVELLALYSSEFASVLEMTSGLDVGVSVAAYSLSRDWIDWIEQKAYIFDPNLSEIPHGVEIAELDRMDGYRRPRMHRKILDLTKPSDVDYLMRCLRDVTASIDVCMHQLGAFIRTHFDIADLL